jgi:hypothetical protein
MQLRSALSYLNPIAKSPKYKTRKLRDSASWPPVWTWNGGEEFGEPVGEVGVLTDVVLPPTFEPDRCFLTIEYGRAEYVGALFFDDATSCRRAAELLTKRIGFKISSIGNLDMSHID